MQLLIYQEDDLLQWEIFSQNCQYGEIRAYLNLLIQMVVLNTWRRSRLKNVYDLIIGWEMFQIAINYFFFIANYNFKPTNTYDLFYECKYMNVYRCFSKVFQGVQVWRLVLPKYFSDGNFRLEIWQKKKSRKDKFLFSGLSENDLLSVSVWTFRVFHIYIGFMFWIYQKNFKQIKISR